jgi:tetraacyldisaccharide 4'-kinase
VNSIMSLLDSIYGAVVRTKNALHERGTLRTHRLQGPVISVGNLAVGGSGKTPFVILLGELLKARGVEFDVLSRGYGRSTTGVLLVDPQGTPQEFGDEPLLIARRLGVPVVVGEKRHEAGQFAEERFGARLHLLDDGFQHRALARDLDIVLVNSSDFQDRLLPGGRLREPLAALKRANVVVLEEGVPYPARRLGRKTVWHVRRGVSLPPVPPRVAAFCGVARPERFFAQLRTAGVVAAVEIPFSDHHVYTEKDMRDLLAVKEEKNCAAFVTTEKDVINLQEHAPRLQPLLAASVTMELLDPEAAMSLLIQQIPAKQTAL